LTPGLFRELLVGLLDVVDGDLHTLPDQLLAQKLASLEHEGDVVERPEGSRFGPVWSVLWQPDQEQNNVFSRVKE